MITSDLVYIRLHGPGEKYRGKYDDMVLESWVEKIRQWSGSNLKVYIYFDNDEYGYAVQNALRIQEIIANA